METAAIEVKDKLELKPNSEKLDLRQKFENKFNESFAMVLNEGKPKISLDIFYSPHETAEDLEGLSKSEKFRQADVYIPEIFGWNKGSLRFLREAALGEIGFEELRKKSKRYSKPFRKTLEGLYNSQKAVTLIDVKSDSGLRKESDTIWDYSPSLDGDFSQLLVYTKTFLQNLSSYITRREDYMLLQITPQRVEELLGRYPWLTSKKEIKILLSFGSGHAHIPDNYNKTSFTDEGIIRSKFGEKVNDDLASKIFLEDFFETLLSVPFSTVRDWLTKDSKKIQTLKRIIIGQLNYKDAQRIFDYCKRMRVFPRDEMERMFSEKNIEIPGNEKELDGLLAKSL